MKYQIKNKLGMLCWAKTEKEAEYFVLTPDEYKTMIKNQEDSKKEIEKLYNEKTKVNEEKENIKKEYETLSSDYKKLFQYYEGQKKTLKDNNDHIKKLKKILSDKKNKSNGMGSSKAKKSTGYDLISSSEYTYKRNGFKTKYETKCFINKFTSPYDLTLNYEDVYKMIFDDILSGKVNQILKGNVKSYYYIEKKRIQEIETIIKKHEDSNENFIFNLKISLNKKNNWDIEFLSLKSLF